MIATRVRKVWDFNIYSVLRIEENSVSIALFSSSIDLASIVAAACLRARLDHRKSNKLFLDFAANFLADFICPANPSFDHLSIRPKEDHLGNAAIVAVSEIGDYFVGKESHGISDLRVPHESSHVINLFGSV